VATAGRERIATLDIVRGVAVMGILAMNIVGFAMPPSAYVNPLAYGSESALDLASYAFNFVLFDGKMRGLFSFLFGASMLLVIERAEARGDSPESVHFRRMLVLLLFGAIHFYLIWYGDILFGYALVGMVAYFFRSLGPWRLVGWGVALVTIQFAMMAAMTMSANALSEAAALPGASAATVREWQDATGWVRMPTPAELDEQFSLHLGPWPALVENQVVRHGFDPLYFTIMFGPETLGYMLLGMAALKSGFLAGTWTDSDYRRVASLGLLITVPLYLLIAWYVFQSHFSPVALMAGVMAAPVLIRPVMIAAVAALVILLTRGGGWLTERIAAAGRAAFSNYLGTSLLMTGLFYGWGLGLYGQLSRFELWLPVIIAWALMLGWSRPWLDRFHYGPLEWLWRSLARGEFQKMRRAPVHLSGRR